MRMSELRKDNERLKKQLEVEAREKDRDEIRKLKEENERLMKEVAKGNDIILKQSKDIKWLNTCYNTMKSAYEMLKREKNQ